MRTIPRDRIFASGLGAVIALAAALTVTARADDFPSKPIRYVLHVSPGGATDVMARKIGQVLQKELGQSFVIENRPGGRGASQMAELVRAEPDGYTIGSVTNTHLAAFQMTLKNYTVDSVSWIAKLAYEPYVYVVRADSGINNMKDLLEHIRTAKEKPVIAGFVKGSGTHVAWEMLLAATQLRSDSVNWVPYNSVGDAVTAVLGDHGLATIAYAGLVRDHVTAGKLKIIGVMATKRIPEAPDVATLAEQGIDVPTSWQQWRGIIGPKGIPADVQHKIAAAAEKAMNGDEMKAFVKSDALVADVEGPDEFARFAHEQDKITSDWLTKLGMKK